MSSSLEPIKWSCPFCPWEEHAHPKYGWASHNDRAVEVHKTRLCRALSPIVEILKVYWPESGGQASYTQAEIAQYKAAYDILVLSLRR